MASENDQSFRQFEFDANSIHLPGFESLPEDMQKAFQAFYQEGGRPVDSFLSAIEMQQPPTTIYHYTDDSGLRGILESGRLWLTDIFGLNDPSELRHGFLLAVETLKQIIGGKHSACDRFVEKFAMFDCRGWIENIAHFFMCSFSSCGDDLGQWRAYADNGRGFALGFDTKMLEDPFVNKDGVAIPNNSTFRVAYDDTQLVNLYRQVMGGILDLAMKPAGRGMGKECNLYMAELQMFLTLHTFRAALFFKHPAYANEQEYRFLRGQSIDSPLPLKFRSRPYFLVKYQEFDWRDSAGGALKQIVIGPAADEKKALRFASDCLRSFHPGDVEIVRSQIPYRAT